MQEPVVGIIGGSGIYKMQGAEIIDEKDISTPYGKPSDLIYETKIDNAKAYFLPRHGRQHKISPTNLPYRANIYALKSLGVTHLLAVSAVGILGDDIHPGDFVIPDQIIDHTKIRKNSFCDEGMIGHLPFADPFCPQWRDQVIEASKCFTSKKVHLGGSYICIEGPRFSSKAESLFFKNVIQATIIGMTACPEASLAREAGISYTLLGLATDYDCWHPEEKDATVEDILKIMTANVQHSQKIIKQLLNSLPEKLPRPHKGTMGKMLVTDKSGLDPALIERLEFFDK